MTQEQKDLLLKDLCARLPYGVKGNYLNDDGTPSNDKLLKKITITYNNLVTLSGHDGMVLKGYIKPYLFPYSDINEKHEFLSTCNGYCSYYWTEETFDWLNKNHIDYRGLIDKGLAIDATNLNIY